MTNNIEFNMDHYHIEHPDETRTLCNLWWHTWPQNFTSEDIILVLTEAAERTDTIPEEEKCDICWRDDEWALLLLAEVP